MKAGGWLTGRAHRRRGLSRPWRRKTLRKKAEMPFWKSEAVQGWLACLKLQQTHHCQDF